MLLLCQILPHSALITCSELRLCFKLFELNIPFQFIFFIYLYLLLNLLSMLLDILSFSVDYNRVRFVVVCFQIILLSQSPSISALFANVYLLCFPPVLFLLLLSFKSLVLVTTVVLDFPQQWNYWILFVSIFFRPLVCLFLFLSNIFSRSLTQEFLSYPLLRFWWWSCFSSMHIFCAFANIVISH